MAEPMLSVEEALERVLSEFHPLEPERVPILEALGRVLAEDVYADVDVPPHANSSMDGFAVRAADTAGAGRQSPVRLRVIADLPAGYVSQVDVTPGTAIRIMTGAQIPPGADAVVRVEDTAAAGEPLPQPLPSQGRGEWVDVFTTVPIGEYVRPAGEDVRRGELVLRRGTLIRPQEVGMLATLGRKEVLAIRRPRVAILATGDEVVEVDAPLAPGKIRNANSYSNAAQVIQYGGIPVMLGIARDQVQELTERIRAGLAQGVDLFLTSGGVSVGDFDVVKDVLAAEGEIHFWRVRIKPGKPLAFGRLSPLPHREGQGEGGLCGLWASHPHPNPLPGREREQFPLPHREGQGEGGLCGLWASHPHPNPLPGRERRQFPLPYREGQGEGVPLLGLPGNPVSVMVAFEMFARPAILKMRGLTAWERPTVIATLMDEIKHKDDRRHYLRVRLEEQDGEYRAYLTGEQGSGILSSMVRANALAIVPEEWSHAPAGARVRVMLLD
jgi:molybdopterin molybdotransferase